MQRKILGTIFMATSGLALIAATPASAACPERLERLKEFTDSGALQGAQKAEFDQMALEAVESEEACQRLVAALEDRLNVEVREDEVVRLTAGGKSGASSQSSTGGQTAAAGGSGSQQSGGSSSQPSTGGQTAAAGSGEAGQTIGGGLDMPREEIDAKYGPLAWMTFDEVIGAQVVDAKGQPISEIVGLVRDLSSGDFYALLDAGTDGVVVPIDHFEMTNDDQVAMSGTAGELDSMPKYDPDRHQKVGG